MNWYHSRKPYTGASNTEEGNNNNNRQSHFNPPSHHTKVEKVYKYNFSEEIWILFPNGIIISVLLEIWHISFLQGLNIGKILYLLMWCHLYLDGASIWYWIKSFKTFQQFFKNKTFLSRISLCVNFNVVQVKM